MLLTALAFLIPAQSQPWEAPAFTGNPAAIVDAAKKLKPPDDADIDILLQEDRIEFDAGGRTKETRRLVYRILSARGQQSWSSSQAHWFTFYDDKPVIRARVITPDGREHLLDPATLGEAPADDEDKREIFDDERVLRGPLPGAGVDSIVEEEIVFAEKIARSEKGSARRAYVGHAFPTRKVRLTVRAPAAVPLKYRARGVELRPAESVAGETRTLVFEAMSVERWPEVLDHLPPDEPARPHIALSTGSSWQEVARAYHGLVADKITVDAVKPMAKEAVGKTKDRRTIIAQLLARVQKQVRYAGLEFGTGSIIPRAPSDTLLRKYGDCKDKAVLLVSMLKAVGVDGRVALLRSGFSEDLQQDMPGLGLFNHAIVYVPGKPELWVDPTHEYAAVDDLPVSDQGRFALIVDPSSKKLVRTPVHPVTHNVYTETRAVRLAEDGEARVLETSEAKGFAAHSLRSYYGERNADDQRRAAESYVKDVYRGTLEQLEVSDPALVDEAFKLVIDAKDVARGYTSSDEAWVVLQHGVIYDWLPRKLDPRNEDKEEDEAKPEKKERKAPYFLSQQYIAELRYRVTLPPGYSVTALPDERTMSNAQARASLKVTREPDGTVVLGYRLETRDRILQPSAFDALKKSLAEFHQQLPAKLVFQSDAATAFAQGRMREGFEHHSRLAALHPREAVHHERLADALIDASFGDAARAEARKAVELEPARATAHFTLAWALMHDATGRLFRKGFDRRGAVAAIEEGLKIEKDNTWARGNLAALHTYSDDAQQFGPGVKVDEAIAILKTLRKELKYEKQNDKLLQAMIRGEKWDDIKTYAPAMPASPMRNAALAVAWTALGGVDGAVNQLARLVPAQKDRDAALASAADELVRVRRYKEAAALLKRVAPSSTNPMLFQTRARLLERVTRYQAPKAQPKDPSEAVLRFVVAAMSPEVAEAELAKLVDPRPAYAGELKVRRENELKLARKNGLPMGVLRDISSALLTARADGDDACGYQVRVETKAPNVNLGQRMYVVKRPGGWRVLFFGLNNVPGLAGEALAHLKKNNVVCARRLLDWAREQVTIPRGDDVLRAPAFAQLWTVGANSDAALTRIAAASAMTGGPNAALAEPILREALTRQLPAETQGSVERALLEVATYKRFSEDTKGVAAAAPKPATDEAIIDAARRLATRYPASDVPFRERTWALLRLGRDEEARKLAQERLANVANDPAALNLLAMAAAERGEFKEAERMWMQLEAAGRATASDLNQLSWMALFSGSSLDEGIAWSQRSNEMTRYNSHAMLNTLGALYAEAGRVSEALEVLKKIDEVSEEEAIDEADWPIYGRLAEHCGLREQALAIYRKLPAAKRPSRIDVQSWRDARLKAMGAAP